MTKTLAVLMASLAILTTACGGGVVGTPTASTTPTQAAASTTTPRPCCTKVVSAYSNISADDWIPWYAFEKGIFKDNGLDVDLQSINGGAQTSAALIAGGIQIGQFGGSEALSANAGGADVVIVANLAPVYPYKLYVQKGITSIQGLKGKKVGVSNAGGSSDIATRAALKAAGLDPDKDVNIIAVGSHANRTAALLAGTIDAGVDDPPEDLELVKAGLTPLIDLASQKLPAANTGVIMQRTYLTANKATVQAYVDSLVIARLKMKSDKAGAVVVLGKYFKLDNQDALNNAYDFFMNEVTVPYLYPEVAQFKDAVEILGKTNDKIKTVDIAKMLDRSFMQSAQDRKLGG
ncbi:MAG: transporter substrate-binding domain-containing protein [Chloroflexi bacterium]|nr:MAG: transporter substrate-binding domain-containing protein [Chloroflexota bacterium]